MKIEERYIESLGCTIEFCIGQNADDNFHVIDCSDPDDLWFHIHGLSSCHVIAKVVGKKIDRKNVSKIVKQGALICKQHSKCRSEKNVHVMFSKVKNLTKTKTVGAVNLKTYKLIVV